MKTLVDTCKLQVANLCKLEKCGFQGNDTRLLVFLIVDFCHMPVFLIDCQRIREKNAF